MNYQTHLNIQSLDNQISWLLSPLQHFNRTRVTSSFKYPRESDKYRMRFNITNFGMYAFQGDFNNILNSIDEVKKAVDKVLQIHFGDDVQIKDVTFHKGQYHVEVYPTDEMIKRFLDEREFTLPN